MIPVQPFGRTGYESTRLLFGAASIGNVSQDEADQTMDLIREHRINHIDTAASYGDAELRLGPWMETHRDSFFLATKTGERTRDGAAREIGVGHQFTPPSPLALIVKSMKWSVGLTT